MALETGTYITDLVSSNPDGALDAVAEGDDHLRLIKSVLRATFPNASRAITFDKTESTKTAAYLILPADDRSFIPVDSTLSDIVISLPSISAVYAGFTCLVMRVDGGNFTVTLDAAGVELINGSPNQILVDQYTGYQVYTDGTTWFAEHVNLRNRIPYVELSSARLLAIGDLETTFYATSSLSITLPAVADLKAGWTCMIGSKLGAVVTLVPDGTETINKLAAPLVLQEGTLARLVVDGVSNTIIQYTEEQTTVAGSPIWTDATKTRLGTTGEIITDWDTAITNGYFRSSFGTTTDLNVPDSTHQFWYGKVVVMNPTYLYQTAEIPHGSDVADTLRYIRHKRSSSAWSTWRRLRITEEEQTTLQATLWEPKRASWTSAPTTPIPAASSVTTYTHSLGVDLSSVQIELECIAADLGYSVGYKALMPQFYRQLHTGITLVKTDLNTVKMYIGSSGFYFTNLSTMTNVNFTGNANFKLTLKVKE